MAVNARRAALKSLVLVCCLSSGLAAATPNRMPHPVQSGLWSQIELVIRGPADLLKALRAMLWNRSSAARKVGP
jgi:hypothetical protein